MKLKTKLKVVAAALAIGLTAQANAALDSPGQGNGSLFLTAWDPNRNVTYVRDLGFNLNDFLPNSFPATASSTENPVTLRTPETGLTLPFAGDALFTTTFGPSAPGDIRWSIQAGDFTRTTTVGGPAGVYRALLTVDNWDTSAPGSKPAGQAPVPPTLSNGQIGDTASRQALFIADTANVNGCDANLSCAFTGIRPDSWPLPEFDAVGEGFNDILGFWAFRGPSSTVAGQPGTKFEFANSAFAASMQLGADGTVTYTLAPIPVGEIPLPAAAWLLLAGLGGLGVVGRRKRAA
jgi:hypothetical protein